MSDKSLLLSIQDAAGLLRISEGLFRQLVEAGELPPGRKVGKGKLGSRAMRWHRADIEAYATVLRWKKPAEEVPEGEISEESGPQGSSGKRNKAH